MQNFDHSTTLSMQRFWTTDSNRKCALFPFNLSSHHHIFIAKSLFTCRDDYFENLGTTTAQACEMFSSGCRPWLKNVACLSSRPKAEWAIDTVAMRARRILVLVKSN